MMGDNKTTFLVGSKAIAAAGTAEQLTAQRVEQGFYLTIHARPAPLGAAPGNTGNIYIGETKALAEAHHFTLEPGASTGLRVDNVSDVWFDADITGDVMEWITEEA